LADAFLQHLDREDGLKAVVADIKTAHAEYLEEAKSVARAHGVDIDKPESGKWNLDITAKTISKLS
jgi:hypothetical protein